MITGLRFIERDGKKILQAKRQYGSLPKGIDRIPDGYAFPGFGITEWFDVPLVVEEESE